MPFVFKVIIKKKNNTLRLKLKHKLVFTNDTNPQCRKVIKKCTKPMRIFESVQNRNKAMNSMDLDVDVFLTTPPCQSFSQAGNGEGAVLVFLGKNGYFNDMWRSADPPNNLNSFF
eukprot:gnl/MRDRNA2_/MRDRNA2_346607_c0_seq1.p1 gnl/MRDRNA2_/MRDRNA2_346607_c0~~gnl/MRDRNA2_/MRDRNA2_346607_c0_seq1.p1  ORF type:complete len:115 (+),score=10.34 gnl/MRDRNA2_/MRDRNA2_346607_c0_seq1:58-402(+)